MVPEPPLEEFHLLWDWMTQGPGSMHRKTQNPAVMHFSGPGGASAKSLVILLVQKPNHRGQWKQRVSQDQNKNLRLLSLGSNYSCLGPQFILGHHKRTAMEPRDLWIKDLKGPAAGMREWWGRRTRGKRTVALHSRQQRSLLRAKWREELGPPKPLTCFHSGESVLL
jgi:hypothetical protein